MSQFSNSKAEVSLKISGTGIRETFTVKDVQLLLSLNEFETKWFDCHSLASLAAEIRR